MPHTKRFGMGVMMRLFLDEDFKEEYIQLVASVKSEEYYVNMMIAWYMATALCKSSGCGSSLYRNTGFLNGYTESQYRRL